MIVGAEKEALASGAVHWRQWITTLLIAISSLPSFAQSAEKRWSIATLAGNGAAGYTGDNGPAAKAQLDNPYGVTRGPNRALYICEVDNHVIRRIALDGLITTVAGTGRRGYSGDGGPALQATLNEPYEVRFDKSGHMLWVEMKNHLVRRLDARTRTISTMAGTGQPGFSGDGGPATKAQLNQPHSIQLDAEGHLYICDIGNNRVRKVDARTGIISTFAGTGGKAPTPDGAPIHDTPLNGPRAIDFDKNGDLWLALREGNAVYKFDRRAGVIRHVAGTGKQGFTGNGGPAKEATLSGPKGLNIGPNGNVYLTDTESHSIRMIDVRRGTLELIAGTGERGDGPDGDALQCRMNRPHGVFVDADGSIIVGDSEAHRVRVIRKR
jgi:DNA-binding beta-propeller fold protein YncE